LYAPEYYQQKGDYLERTFSGYFAKVAGKPALNQMLYVDTKTWLADDLLLKADRMTMAASVELRVPFLDHRLVEYAAGLPPSYKNRGGNGKYLLKKIMEPRVPHEIIYRKKRGFPVPTNTWFGHDLLPYIRERIGAGHRLPWINVPVIERMLKHQQGRVEDHSKMILSLLILSTWMEQYIEQ
jgi:asparagine synthase (glutamine-hydrolysing)